MKQFFAGEMLASSAFIHSKTNMKEFADQLVNDLVTVLDALVPLIDDQVKIGLLDELVLLIELVPLIDDLVTVPDELVPYKKFTWRHGEQSR